MGDLSHELESLVNFFDSGGALPDSAAFDVLQASVDELARMRDSVAAGRGVAPARECIARIRALLNPGQVAPPAAVAPAVTGRPACASRSAAATIAGGGGGARSTGTAGGA